MRLVLLIAVCLTACAGPPAPDAALCRDLIARLCIAPMCGVVETQLAVSTADCDATLTARTGCGTDDFELKGTLTRNRLLECRNPLVRNSTSRLVAPGCDNVAEMFTSCPDLVRFLGGTP